VAEPITEEVPRPGATKSPDQQSTIQLVRSIATDTSALVRKEVELARQELTAAVMARLVGAGALAVAGLFGLLIVIFLALAAAEALDLVFAPWLSRLIVAGGFLLLAGIAALVGLRKMKKPSFAPEETKRTVKEDVEWAKTQLKR
jgi:uncharacterized membrane protein YqgA involved in biofilm formation